MTFSIIVVCYNAGEKLEKTIASIRRQTEDDYEIIVQDGLSADGSVERDAMAVFCCILPDSSMTTCATTTRTMPRRSRPLSHPWWMARTPAIPMGSF